MDERRESPAGAPIGGELLAAYLAAETDEVTSARIERQLRDDPEAAARLDALARTRARLQRLDAVQPPPELRARLAAGLRAERAQHAAGGDHPARSAAAAPAIPVPAAPAPATTTAAQHRSAPRQRWRTAPFAAAAAVVLVAVIGGVTLLSQSAGMDEAATDMAGGESVEAPAAAPFAAPEESGDAALGAGQGDGAAEADDRSAAESAGAAAPVPGLPRVRDDDHIVARLDEPARATGDPTGAEADLRQRFALAPLPSCLSGVDAAAVDLVERDGVAVLSALVRTDGGRRVALYDVGDCSRLRTFAP